MLISAREYLRRIVDNTNFSITKDLMTFSPTKSLLTITAQYEECGICFDEEVKCFLWPCCHSKVCRTCLLKQRKFICVFCQRNCKLFSIEKTLKLYKKVWKRGELNPVCFFNKFKFCI